ICSNNTPATSLYISTPSLLASFGVFTNFPTSHFLASVRTASGRGFITNRHSSAIVESHTSRCHTPQYHHSPPGEVHTTSR
ncbi:hypothetical protein GCK32_017793, partial [Trichostrongylus colubriformis]